MNYQQLLARLMKDLPLERVSNEVYKMVMPGWFWTGAIIIGAIIALIVIWMVVYPIYDVWASKKRGQGELAYANYEEQVAIAQATARLKSAEMNKKAEIVEAEAVSDSIAKIGNALQQNEGYLRWQWIKTMGDSENEKIYIPTEANLPILEAKTNLYEDA